MVLEGIQRFTGRICRILHLICERVALNGSKVERSAHAAVAVPVAAGEVVHIARHDQANAQQNDHHDQAASPHR